MGCRTGVGWPWKESSLRQCSSRRCFWSASVSIQLSQKIMTALARHRLITSAFILLVRTICLVLMSCKYSDLNEDSSDDDRLNVMIRLLLDLPTLLLIFVFSAFSYYLSRLNMEVETILHQMDDVSLLNQSIHRSGRSSTAPGHFQQDQISGGLNL